MHKSSKVPDPIIPKVILGKMIRTNEFTVYAVISSKVKSVAWSGSVAPLEHA